MLVHVLHLGHIISITLAFAVILTNSVDGLTLALLRPLSTSLSGELGPTVVKIQMGYLLVLALTWTQTGTDILVLLGTVLLRSRHVELRVLARLGPQRSSLRHTIGSLARCGAVSVPGSFVALLLVVSSCIECWRGVVAQRHVRHRRLI